MWEDRARKASHVGNQAAGFTRYLAEVQIKQVKLLKDTVGKGKKAPPTNVFAIIQYLVGSGYLWESGPRGQRPDRGHTC